MLPNCRVVCLGDFESGGLQFARDQLVDINVKWILGGMISCVLPNGEEVDLRDERLSDPQVRIVADLSGE